MPTPTSSSLSNHTAGEKSKSSLKLYSNAHDGNALKDITGRSNALSRSVEDIATKSKGAKLVSRSHSVSSKYCYTNPKVDTKLWEASSIGVHKMRSPSSNSTRVAWKQVGSGANINVQMAPMICNPKQAAKHYSAKPFPLPQSRLHENRHISSDPSILATVKYWLAQIKLSEAARKHMISIGFFRLAFECKAEPLGILQGELVAYINRHSLCSEEINKLLLCYGIEGQDLRKECLKTLEKNVNHCEPNSLQATSVELETIPDTIKHAEEKEMARMGESIFHRAFIKQLPLPVVQTCGLQESEREKVTKPPFKTTHINVGPSYCDLRDKSDGDNSKIDIMKEDSMEAGSLFQESTEDKARLGSDMAVDLVRTMDVNALMKEVVSHIMSSMDENNPTDGKDLEDKLSAAIICGRRYNHADKPEQQMPELMGNVNSCKVQEIMSTYGCNQAVDSMQFISSVDTPASIRTMDVNTLMKEVVSHIMLSMGEESKEALVCSIMGGIERPVSCENTAVLNDDLSEVLINQGKEAQSNKKMENRTSLYVSGGDPEAANISPKCDMQSHDILTMVSNLKGDEGLTDISVKVTTDLINFDGSSCDQSSIKAGNITSLYTSGGGGPVEKTISPKEDMQSYDILTTISDLKGNDELTGISVKGADSIDFDGSLSEQAQTPIVTRIKGRQKTPFKPKIATVLDSQIKECCLATPGYASGGSTKTNRRRQSLNWQSSHSSQQSWNIGSTRNEEPAATVNGSRCKSQDKPTKQKLILLGDFEDCEAQESIATPGSCGLRRSMRLLSVASVSTPVSELKR